MTREPKQQALPLEPTVGVSVRMPDDRTGVVERIEGAQALVQLRFDDGALSPIKVFYPIHALRVVTKE